MGLLLSAVSPSRVEVRGPSFDSSPSPTPTPSWITGAEPKSRRCCPVADAFLGPLPSARQSPALSVPALPPDAVIRGLRVPAKPKDRLACLGDSHCGKEESLVLFFFTTTEMLLKICIFYFVFECNIVKKCTASSHLLKTDAGSGEGK